MAPKIIAAALALVANLAGGVVLLFMMLIAMNGYSESDAQWGLIAYIALAFGVTVLMTLAAVLLVRRLVRKDLSSVAAVLIAVPALSVLGIVLEIVASLIGVGIAEFVRVNY